MTATQLQTMSIPQQYQVSSLDTPLKLPFDNANFSQPRLCRGICFSAANAWYSNNHLAEDSQCSGLFARAEETKRLLMPELLHIWATSSFWDLGVFSKISLADASLAVELRMSGWPKDENGTKVIDLYPTIWLKTADKVVKAKSPWKEIAAVVKRLRLNSPQYAKIFVEGGGRLSDNNVTVTKENLTLDKGISFPNGETLYLHILAKPGRSSACGLPCLVTIIKDEEVLEQSISRIGGLVTYVLPRQAVTSGHVMTKYFLTSCARDASSDLTDDSAIEMEDSDESDIELVQNYESDNDPEQSLGYINVTKLTDWRSVMPSDNINFVIQLSKDTDRPSVWKINTSQPIPTDFALLSDVADWERDNYYVDPPAQGAPSDTSARVKKCVSSYHNDKSLGTREVLILVNQESESLVGSLQTAVIPLIIGSATLGTRKLRLQGPLAPGTSGSWVVDRVSGALCGSIIMVYDDEPYALMITAQALLSDIKTYSSMDAYETTFPTVSKSTWGEVQERQSVAIEGIHKLSIEDDNLGKPHRSSSLRIQPSTPVKQESGSEVPIVTPSAGKSISFGQLKAWESEIGLSTNQPETNAWTSDSSVKGKHRATEPRPHHLPFSRNKNFTGRKEVIDELRRLLFTHSDDRRVALVGLGGVGKSQIALELACLSKNSSESYQHCSVIWMPALSLASFEYECTEMIKAFNIEHVANKDPKKAFKDFLSSEAAGKWFLIIDGADDMKTLYGTSRETEGIAKFIPECKQGCILFTTRSREIARRVAESNILELSGMDMKEARALLHNSSIQRDQIQDTAITDQLLQELAYLPLAITLASAYMNINKVQVKEYLQLLQSTSQRMGESLRRGIYGSNDYNTLQDAVLTTCIVSFEQIRDSHEDATILLSFVAYLEPKAIPLALLSLLGPKQSMTNAISTLCNYNFFSQREDGDIFDMHISVHLATQIWNQNEGRKARIQQLAFSRANKAFLTNSWENREVWRQYLPHALRFLRSWDIRSEEACRLGCSIALCLRVDGKIRQAIDLLEHVVAVQKLLPENHPDRLTSQHALALAYQDYGQIKEAVQLLEHVVAIQKTALAEKHPNRLGSEHNLAVAYHYNRKIDDAIQLLRHVVTVRNAILSKDHSDRLASQHALAIAYGANGQIEDATQLLEHVVAVQRITLAEDHPTRLVSEESLEYFSHYSSR